MYTFMFSTCYIVWSRRVVLRPAELQVQVRHPFRRGVFGHHSQGDDSLPSPHTLASVAVVVTSGGRR